MDLRDYLKSSKDPQLAARVIGRAVNEYLETKVPGNEIGGECHHEDDEITANEEEIAIRNLQEALYISDEDLEVLKVLIKGQHGHRGLRGLTGLQGNQGPIGPIGAEGRAVELQVTTIEPRYLQWRYEGDTVWLNLLAIDDITSVDIDGGNAASVGYDYLNIDGGGA